MAVLEDVSIFLTNIDVDVPVLLDLLEVDGTMALDFPEEVNFIGTLLITPESIYCKLCENMQL